MGTFYHKPARKGDSPYTRTGLPSPELKQKSHEPIHRVAEPMSLELYMADEAYRKAGLTPAEREWRAKWLKDQVLHPDEPIQVDAVYRQLNPIRMLYRTPLDKLYMHFLRPTFGAFYGSLIRVTVPKVFMVFLFVETFYYIWKYEQKDWQRLTGMSHSFHIRATIDRKDEIDREYPGLIEKALVDPAKYRYFDPGFVKHVAHIDIGETNRPW